MGRIRTWVARDENGKLYLYIGEKPHKVPDGYWEVYSGYHRPIEQEDLPEGVDPKWEDEKATDTEIKIIKFQED